MSNGDFYKAGSNCIRCKFLLLCWNLILCSASRHVEEVILGNYAVSIIAVLDFEASE